MSSSSRPLSSSLVAVPESCAAASPYFSYSSTSSPHSAFSSSPSPSFSSSSSSSSHSSSSFSSTLPSSNFGSTSAEYYQQNHHHHQLPMMAASLDGSNMMKLYNSNGNSKLESFESNNNSWNGGLYGNGTTKVPAYQQQQSQPQQQLDQINFLVRKECCNEIDQAVKELGISADPFNWSVSDVQKWLLWMQRWVQLPSLKLEHFAMDGMSLCALTEEDFRQRVPNGEKLYAKLDIWRMAFNYFGATDFDSIFGEFQEDNNSNNSYGQQQQQQQQQYCASPYSTSSSTDASSLYSGSSPISPEGYGVSNGSGCGSLPTYAESMYGGGMCGSGSIASPASPASSSHSSVNSCSPYGQQQQNSYGYGQTMVAPQQQQQQQQYGKASLLPMNDFSNMANTGAMITAVVNGGGAQPMQQQRMVATSDYGSDAIPSDDDDMSDDEKCFLEFQHHHHRMTLQQQQQQQHQQQLMQLQQQQQQQQQQQMQSVVGNGRGSLPLSVPQIKVESRADYSPSTSPVYHQGLQHQHQQHLMQQQQQFGHPRPPVHHQQQHQQRQYAQHPNGMVVGNHSISVVKSELPSSSSTTTTPIAVPAAPVPTAPAVAVAPVRTSSSHIHLWQFLKELLSGPHQYGSSIRWLDRSKGVFKIEDSVSVAKLWGARKNRPAMNYDKLSRSIRQYYKKGIMKKTERSQRLVYQFCAPYAL